MVKKRTLAIASLSACLAVGAIAAFVSRNPTVHVDINFDSYRSVEDVLNTTDTAVVGVVGRTVDHQVDDGALKGDAGTPMVLQEVRVEEALANKELEPGSTIVLASIDPERTDVAEEPLVQGQRVLLLVVQLPKARMPGLSGFDVVYGRVGLNSSVFDVGKGAQVMPRDHGLKHLAADAQSTFTPAADVGATAAPGFTVDDIRRLIASRGDRPLLWGRTKQAS